jgi:hypothetical protein
MGAAALCRWLLIAAPVVILATIGDRGPGVCDEILRRGPIPWTPPPPPATGGELGGSHLRFELYTPSSVELEWFKRIVDANPTTCSAWDEGSSLRQALAASGDRLAGKGPVDEQLHSRLLFGDPVTSKHVVSRIEPLVGSLRHHSLGVRAKTTTRGALMAKTHYVLPDRAHLLRVLKAGGRLLFYDIGASLYSSGAGGDGGASQKWFSQTFGLLARRPPPGFDDIWAWEAHPYAPEKLWGSFPPEIIPHIHYYNVPASTDPNSPFNPWNTLRATARPGDFVVVKLDVVRRVKIIKCAGFPTVLHIRHSHPVYIINNHQDHQPTELALLRQLLADPMLHINEFFWEHHVAGSLVACPKIWGGGRGSGWGTMHFNVTPGSLETLADSYAIFMQLRCMGIRAHSWV